MVNRVRDGNIVFWTIIMGIIVLCFVFFWGMIIEVCEFFWGNEKKDPK